VNHYENERRYFIQEGAEFRGRISHTFIYDLMKGEYRTVQSDKLMVLSRVTGIPVSAFTR